MDINYYLQSFEASVKNYAGEDPLDPWDKFVEFLECRLPSEEKRSISVVLDRLVHTFLQDKRYHNDSRFVNHCIKCASFHSDVTEVYSSLHGEGVGSLCAAFYVSWAQHLEQRGLLAQAMQVYQKAEQNQAEPLDTVQQQCRLFQSRSAKSQMGASEHVRNPLHNSLLVNQNPQQRAVAQQPCKEPEDSPSDRTVRIISRSENNPKATTSSSAVECVSMYCVKELQCDGVELCFEELRARRYFSHCRHLEQLQHQEEALRQYEKEKEEIKKMKKRLEELNSKLSDQPDHVTSTRLPQELLCSVSHSVPKPVELGDERRRSERPALEPGPWSVSVSPAQGCSILTLRKSQSFQLLEGQRLPGDGHPCVTAPLLSAPPLSDHHTHPAAAFNPPSSRAVCQPDPLTRTPTALLPPDQTTMAFVQETPATFPLGDMRASRGERPMLHPGVQQGAALARETSAEVDTPADTSHGAHNHSHVTPNTSLGLISATPSRALPSPTVNTREALDVIMDMFQAPTLLQDTFFGSMSQAPDDSFEKSCRVMGVAPSVKAACSVPFRIFQDESDESRVEMVKPKPMAARALVEIPVSKSAGVDSLSNDSAVWGPRYGSVAACPSITRDFTLDKHLASTPLHTTAPYTSLENGPRGFSEVEENPYLRQPTKLSPILEQSPSEEKPSDGAECTMRGQGTIVGEGMCLPQQGHTLSQSQHNQTSCSISRQPLAPLAFPDSMALPAPTEARGGTSTRPSWSIYQSPEISTSRLQLSVRALEPEQLHPNQLQPPALTGLSSGQEDADVLLPKISFHRYKSQKHPSEKQDFYQDPCRFPATPKRVLGTTQDIPMSPDPAHVIEHNNMDVMVRSSRTSGAATAPLYSGLRPWVSNQCPGQLPDSNHEPVEESDLEQSGILLSKRSFNRRKSEKRVLEVEGTTQKSLLMSPKPLSILSQDVQDVPMSPEPAQGLSWLNTDSPARVAEPDLDVLMTPQHIPAPPAPLQQCDMEVPLSPARPPAPAATRSRLVPDPWDEDLIVSLLSNLHIPLSCHPSLTVSSHSLRTVTPKMTVQMAEQCLRVDFVLGQGAFATVYQATDLTTSQKCILKVQKPANPWEFYINEQLNTRVQPTVRHLFSQLRSAHLFSNGSVLVGELHNCGTLLSVVNLYKCRSEKVMPQALVLYLAVCILRIVEELHQARLIHADIKPDNFLLGQRFLENENLDVENLDHGLVLIDFGQSIDMNLFPSGTAFTARCMTSGFQCTEMMSGRPWTYQTDYFGLAGTVHCMLFGSYMQVRNEGGVWKSNGVFKRNPHSELWQEFFHTLLNIPDCETLPCLRSLRVRLTSALQENYSKKLCSLKKLLVVQILEARSSRR